MSENLDNFYLQQPIQDYENSHRNRLDHLIDDLGFNDIKNARIGDFGCGYGPIFKRLKKDNNNILFGFDGAELTNESLPFNYRKTNLSFDFFADEFLKTEKQLDYAVCFETLEHLSNPYHALVQIKKILKNDGILFVSIPHESVTHNTIYPALLYPVDNFIEFLKQMALTITKHSQHDKSFKQEVFILQNKSWEHNRMKWYKPEAKFYGVPPLEAINL